MDFPESDMSCEDLVRCLLGLKKKDLDTYKELLKSESGVTADEMGELLGKERSTAYRSLQRLIECGLAFKETRTIKEGGYFYIYHPAEPEKAVNLAEECLEDWYEEIQDAVEDLKNEFRKSIS